MNEKQVDDSQPAFEKDAGIAPLWLIVVSLVLPTIITYIYFFVLSTQSKPIQSVGMGLCKAIQFGLPIFWLVKIRRWNNNFQRPNSNAMIPSLIFGAVIFALALALFHGWLKQTAPMQAAMVEIQAKVAEMGLATPMKFIGLAAFYTVCHSLLEEYYWRWFVFGMVRQRTAIATAIVVSSLGFMAHHVLVLSRFFGPFSIGTWFFSFCVAVGGAIWAWQYHKTGRLYAPWLSHAIIDAVIFTIGYAAIFG